MKLVIDASIALSWCFEDEASPETDAVADEIGQDGALVPGLFHLEIANILLQAERRGRLTPAGVAARLNLIGELFIATDAETSHQAWHNGLALARAHRLTSYDAAYLELALRTGRGLATRDGELREAARTLGVAIRP